MEKYLESFNVIITGITPLIMNKYVVGSISAPKLHQGRGNRSLEFKDKWKNGVYTNPSGNVVIPSGNILSCMFKGSSGLKKGKYYLSRLVFPSLIINPFEPEVLIKSKLITIEDIEKNEWLKMDRGVTSTGVAMDIIRAQLPIGWQISFQLSLTNEQLVKEDIVGMLSKSGMNAGLGENRPSSPKKPGPHGRFEVLTFESV